MSILAIQPRISEKSYILSQNNNVYTFDVPMTANKLRVAEAVSSQYKVTVEDVRTTVIKGKAKKTARKRSQPIKGARKSVKKAYVTLKQGDKIDVFETEGEA